MALLDEAASRRKDPAAERLYNVTSPAMRA